MLAKWRLRSFTPAKLSNEAKRAKYRSPLIRTRRGLSGYFPTTRAGDGIPSGAVSTRFTDRCRFRYEMPRRYDRVCWSVPQCSAT